MVKEKEKEYISPNIEQDYPNMIKEKRKALISFGNYIIIEMKIMKEVDGELEMDLKKYIKARRNLEEGISREI